MQKKNVFNNTNITNALINNYSKRTQIQFLFIFFSKKAVEKIKHIWKKKFILSWRPRFVLTSSTDVKKNYFYRRWGKCVNNQNSNQIFIIIIIPACFFGIRDDELSDGQEMYTYIRIIKKKKNLSILTTLIIIIIIKSSSLFSLHVRHFFLLPGEITTILSTRMLSSLFK